MKIEFKPHIKLCGGWYRVYYRSLQSGRVYTGDQIKWQARALSPENSNKLFPYISRLNADRADVRIIGGV